MQRRIFWIWTFCSLLSMMSPCSTVSVRSNNNIISCLIKNWFCLNDQLYSLSPAEWPEFVSSYAPWWASHALSWLKFGRHLLVVHYEELQRALLPQLRLITAFLNVTMTEERLLCAQSNQDGHFKRSGAQRPSFDPFTTDMRQMIDPLIQSVDRALQSRNFSRLPQEYLHRWWSEKVMHSLLNGWSSWGLQERSSSQSVQRETDTLM